MARTRHARCRFTTSRRYMAKPPVTIPELVSQFGPTLNRIPAHGWNAEVEPDRIVKTHCCFCGQQCGIELRVRNNKVIGFEPWEDFPFNKGKLCPKGKAVLENIYNPDRLKYPLKKNGSGWERISWDQALDEIAARLLELKQEFGPQVMFVL